MQRTVRRISIPLLCGWLLVGAVGCWDTDSASDPGPPEETFDLAVPADVVQAWAAAFEKKDFAAYEELLAENFEFFPRQEDLDDFSGRFPWMTGDSWGRTVELGLAANLFDPDYSGVQPPVQQIGMNADLLSQHEDSDRFEMIVHVVGHVLTGPVDGFAFDTRLTFELVPFGSRCTILRIWEETTLPRAADVTGVDSTTFGTIRILYF